MKNYSVLVFVILTFLISHVVNPIIVELVRILFPSLSFDFPAAQLNERSLINQYGGTLAALLVTIKLYGMDGLKSMLRFSRITVQTAPWIGMSVLFPLIMILLAYALAGIHLSVLLAVLMDNWPFYLLIIGGFILSAGLAEEFGWRGFLLPQLLKTCKPLTATFITFLIVSLWHFPALLSGWKGEPVMPWIILSFPIAVVHSWLFFKSRGNLWVAIVFHACFDAQYSFYSHYIHDDSVPNIPFHQGWTYIVLYCWVAFLIIVFTKGSLGYDSSTLNLNKYFGEKKHERPTPPTPITGPPNRIAKP
ncbi:MAG: CPBP family intramembrane metalloprotease [Flavisolibacter sp.]|nr:CPBP family intramembrane metalloprotease [Flavisolibacter sp.]